jgi:hypothetical protein
MSVKIGNAKYGGTKKQYFKLKEGASTFRILPPLGDLADDGVWSQYYRVHYGYTNSAGKSRPFESSLVKSQKGEVEIPDAAVDRFNKLKSRLDEALKAGDKKTADALKKLVGAKDSRYNLDNNHYMNAIDLQGNIGVLKLRHTAKKALDLLIRKLRDKGVDPLSQDNGRFFTFTRSGQGRETAFAVEVFKQAMQIQDVGEVEREVVHKLTPDIIQRLGTEAAQLDKLFKTPTAAQIDQIVNESNLQTGVSANIDEILGYKKEETAGDGDAEADEVESFTGNTTSTGAGGTAETQQPVATAPAPAPAAKPAAIVETKVETKPEPKKATPATAPTTTAQKVSEMSDDEFLDSLGLK